MGGKKERFCAYCEGALTGCSCGWKKTSDGQLVHRNCKEKYENELKNKKPTCAYCGEEFESDPYFQADDGRFVHFKCQALYNQKIKNR